MNVDGISTVSRPQNSSAPPNSELAKKTLERSGSVPSVAANDQVQLQMSVPRQSFDTLQKIGSITDSLNATANGVRSTDNKLSASEDIAAKMRSTLEKITKNFPPFSIDSVERKDILMSYSALRKEIEKMTIPPPPAPLYEKVQTLWQDLFESSSNGTVSTPNLDTNASDTAITNATKQLAATGNAISTLHAAISAAL